MISVLEQRTSNGNATFLVWPGVVELLSVSLSVIEREEVSFKAWKNVVVQGL